MITISKIYLPERRARTQEVNVQLRQPCQEIASWRVRKALEERFRETFMIVRALDRPAFVERSTIMSTFREE